MPGPIPMFSNGINKSDFIKKIKSKYDFEINFGKSIKIIANKIVKIQYIGTILINLLIKKYSVFLAVEYMITKPLIIKKILTPINPCW